MRIVVLMLAAALLLTACQQPAGNTTPSSGDSSQFSGLGNEQFGAEKDGQMRYFRSEGDATAKELALRLLEACYGKVQSQDQSRFQACMRDQMTTAFDDSGKGRAACRQFSALDAYADCMVVGNMVLDIRHRLDDDTPVEADFWSSKDNMVHAMVKSVVIGATTNCMSRGSESEMLAARSIGSPSSSICPMSTYNGVARTRATKIGKDAWVKP